MGDSPMERFSYDEDVKILEEEEKVKDDVEDMKEPPNWLPDGWIMEASRGDDGTIYQYYTSPVSGYTFTLKSDVLQYLFSEMDERILESQNSIVGNKFQRTHEWLPNGWVIEVRAGGEKMDKMYKFYVHTSTGIRLFSKEDVMLYAKEMKISKCDTNGQCDMSTDNNILATVEFNPSPLPQGWVKEVVFRKTKERVRKDPYYTDPISCYVFRTLKSAMCYVETGEKTKRAFIQKTSVHDLYSFEKSADLHYSLCSRLILNGKTDKNHKRSSQVEKVLSNDETSYSSEDGDTSADSDAPNVTKEIKLKGTNNAGKKATSSKTAKRPRGRTPKIARQTNGNTSREDPQYERGGGGGGGGGEEEEEEETMKTVKARAEGEMGREAEVVNRKGK